MSQRTLLEIADEVRALARTGLQYTEGSFDRERYERLLQLAARLAGLAMPEQSAEIERLYLGKDPGYATPKLDVRTAVFREGRVLLVREVHDGLWALPGGFVDVGDSPSEAAVREVAEEAGVEVRVRRLIGIFDNRAYPDVPPHLFHIHKLLFLGELLDPSATPHACPETLDAAFAPLDALPELSLGRTLPMHITLALAALRDPALPPHYD